MFICFSLPHVVGKPVCLYMLCHGAREACLGVSTKSNLGMLGSNQMGDTPDRYWASIGILGPQPNSNIRIVAVPF